MWIFISCFGSNVVSVLCSLFPSYHLPAVALLQPPHLPLWASSVSPSPCLPTLIPGQALLLLCYSHRLSLLWPVRRRVRLECVRTNSGLTKKQITSQVISGIIPRHILWWVYLEMLGTYSVGGISGHTCYTCWTYPVGGIPRNAGYTSCKGYLPETFNPIEVKHARNTMIVQAATPEPPIIQSCSLRNSKYPGFQSHTKEWDENEGDAEAAWSHIQILGNGM